MLYKFLAETRKRGFARNSRYRVFIPVRLLNDFYAGKNTDSELVSLYCESLMAPGINMNTTENRIFGEFRRFPYERQFGEVHMSFYMDSDQYIKSLFDNWFSKIIDPTTRNISYYKDYVGEIIIETYSMDDREKTSTIKLYEAYPKTMYPVQYFAEGRDITKLMIDFEYRYWEEFNESAAKEQGRRQENKARGNVLPGSANVPSAVGIKGLVGSPSGPALARKS